MLLAEWLVTSAVRYCLPRHTYVVGECCDWLKANWENLTDATKRIVEKDIEDALVRDTSMWEMDREQWESVAELWRNTNAAKQQEASE